MTVEQSFGPMERHAAQTLITMALMEDLGDRGDLTCQALIPADRRAEVNVVSRKPGVLSASPIGRMVFSQLDNAIQWKALKSDGDRLQPGDVIATVSGPLNALLVGERTMLNFMTHLSGIASLTAQFVERIAGTRAVILDTRKTLPGYRRLEKYAVRCGGGTNHRMGLFDGVLIKDNHLAAWTANASIAAAVKTAREQSPPGVSVEVEVDTLDQLRDALQGRPDIVLLDNMPPGMMREAVAIRDAAGQGVLLEASGGVTLDTVRAIAETGVERISIGGLTHSAPALDLAFDWKEPEDAFVI
ncbi:MAG TPA: carboxylating nicotinate-nucleotide diphosphorylase [Planctomycetaceae bacterium]|nr:carboxylating nicotinate-nucleotide diphosphorylase [Planctomycetaceae bacterium]